jgi:hypothetical protein
VIQHGRERPPANDGERTIRLKRPLPHRGLQRASEAVSPGARVAEDGYVLGVLDGP